jgi:uncharacterized lipoprotein YmbA
VNRAARHCQVAALGVALAFAGCSSPPPVLYTIARVRGTAESGAPKVVILQHIAVARYLERSEIVRSSENYRLEVMSNDWWGEPLGAMLGRVLVEELSQRLPESVVLSESGAISASPDATIELNLQRLDQDAANNVILLAQASVRFKGRKAPELQSFQFSVRPSAPGTAGEVAAISAAVGRLADGLATTLASR